MKPANSRFIDSLVSRGIIDAGSLDALSKEVRRRGGRLGKVLVEKRLLSEDEFLSVASEELGLQRVDLAKFAIPLEVVGLLPERIMRRYGIFPVSHVGETVTIAVSDPTNLLAVDDVKSLTGFEVALVLAPAAAIAKLMDSHFSPGSGVDSAAAEATTKDRTTPSVEGEEGIDLALGAEESSSAPIVRMVNLILTQGITGRASDIHLEPYEDRVRVRYRVDGGLQEGPTIPRNNQAAVTARLKIVSGMDITETRVPQDGRFKVRIHGKEIDFRVSALPVTYGEKMVLRALDKTNLTVGLETLGFLPEPLADFQKAIATPYGMILVTGPTGSGKSTTLYAVLNRLNQEERNIVTVEDPVEYQVEGITQVQVRPEIGLSFANGLRALTRQSPDVMMVGEIRDYETADIAVKASLTGHLVLSTLHTNDAIGAITRLIDMGVEPFLVATSLIMSAAQRLCRRVCDYCSEPEPLTEEAIQELGITPEMLADANIRKSVGCSKCNGTGYHGRMATLETFVLDDRAREMIAKRASASKISDYAVSKGMRSLRQNVLTKALRGWTTLDEVRRLTAKDS
ncbi:MAG: Flp pilus assembly complex ATPase component TadA [Candidatus Omnitrophica bacterium]|nr:Flp pilus assembly complex ATPase component TadA [Candidatus Omnitrophota bacterium]